MIVDDTHFNIIGLTKVLKPLSNLINITEASSGQIAIE